MANDTFFCRLTPQGRGAIATTMVWGPQALTAVETFFRRARKGGNSGTPGSVVYGFWKSSNVDVAEDVVLSIDAHGRYSIHSHGGLISQSLIAGDLQQHGLREVSQAEFELIDSGNFWLAQIRLALQQATTIFAAQSLLDQLQVWPDWLREVRQRLEKKERDAALAQIQSAIQRSAVAIHLTTPWRVVLCGQPNVGKSSLINALLGYERVIVSELAGTTRDIVRQSAAIGGWPIILTDTAGLRESNDEIEKIGVELANQEAAVADLLIGVFDASLPWSESDQQFLGRLSPHLVVFNKADILVSDPQRPAGLLVSAKDQSGLDELLTKILQVLIPDAFAPNLPAAVTSVMLDRLHQLNADISADDFNCEEPCLTGLFDTFSIS